MSYTKIDPIIYRWIEKHGLHLLNQYQDVEVRAVHVVDSSGRTYRIGIEQPDSEGRIAIRACAWDFKKRNQLFYAIEADLGEHLEQAFELLKSWMSSSV